MQNVSSAFQEAIQAPQRQTAVKIAFGIYDLTAKGDAQSSANENQSFSSPQQVLDDIKTLSKKYATLEPGRWLLNGTFFCFPDEPEEEAMGYWSNSMSDATGFFSVAPTVTITFGSNHSSLGLTFYFDTLTGDCCKDFTVLWRDAAGATLAQKAVTGNTEAWCWLAEAVENYRSIVLTFQSTNRPFRYVHFAEIDFGLQETYTSDQLIEAQMIQEMDILTNRLTAGRLSFSLDNSDHRFNILDPQGAQRFLQRQQKFSVQAGVETTQGWQWVPWGEYYLKEWENPGGPVTKFDAYDSLELLAQVNYAVSPFYNEAPASQVFLDILNYGGVAYQIDPSFQTVYLTGYIPVKDCRQALHNAALAAGALVRVNAAGEVCLLPSTPGSRVGELGKDLVLGQAQVKQLALTNQVEVTCYQYTVSENITQLYQGNIPIYGTQKVWLDYQVVPATNVSATLSAGTLVASDFRANGAYLTINANGIVRITLNGKVYSESTYLVRAEESNIPSGELPQTAVVRDNRLIATAERAQSVAQRLLTGSLRRYQQTFRWWANPAIEVGDVVLAASQYDGTLELQLTKSVYQFNGGLAVKSEGIGL